MVNSFLDADKIYMFLQVFDLQNFLIWKVSVQKLKHLWVKYRERWMADGSGVSRSLYIFIRMRTATMIIVILIKK